MTLITSEEYCAAIDRHSMLTATKEELESLIHTRRGKPNHSDEIVVVSAHRVLEQRRKGWQR